MSAVGHGELNNYLGNCGILPLKEAQSKLASLFNQRIKADYRMAVKEVERIVNAEKALKTSEKIIKTFESYESSSGLKKIAKGIDDYLKKIKSAPKAD